MPQLPPLPAGNPDNLTLRQAMLLDLLTSVDRADRHYINRSHPMAATLRELVDLGLAGIVESDLDENWVIGYATEHARATWKRCEVMNLALQTTTVEATSPPITYTPSPAPPLVITGQGTSRKSWTPTVGWRNTAAPTVIGLILAGMVVAALVIASRL